MNRRGFFATLLAPIVAKCLPKTKPAGEVIFHLPHSIGYKFGWTGFKTSGSLQGLDAYARENIIPKMTASIFQQNPIFCKISSREKIQLYRGDRLPVCFVGEEEDHADL